MTFAVRQAHPSDLPRLYRICLETGDSGGDATPLVHDPDLLGHLYLGPYLTRESDSAFVLTKDHKPCGYIVGTPRYQPHSSGPSAHQPDTRSPGQWRRSGACGETVDPLHRRIDSRHPSENECPQYRRVALL